MDNFELITNAVAYIQTSCTQSNLTTETIAANAGFSIDYFNRLFFAHTGFHTMEYVRFCRLKNAARLLRVSQKDILTIAFDCGYETHESFSRAFKKQYGVSPSEYRKANEAKETCYGELQHETLTARLLQIFPDWKIADTDAVIDDLLSQNAVRYGYTAACFHINGGVALYRGADTHQGFVWFSEWDGKIEGQIICSEWEKTIEYLKLLDRDPFIPVIHSTDQPDTVHQHLQAAGISPRDIVVESTYVCTEFTGLPTPPEGITMRALLYEDLHQLESFFQQSGMNVSRQNYLRRGLYQRDILGNNEHSVFSFGIFYQGRIIGVSDGANQRVHSFAVNNCVSTVLLPSVQTEELYRYAFAFVTNEALAQGVLPIDDLQTPQTPPQNRCGTFCSQEFGYRVVDCSYQIL